MAPCNKQNVPNNPEKKLGFDPHWKNFIEECGKKKYKILDRHVKLCNKKEALKKQVENIFKKSQESFRNP